MLVDHGVETDAEGAEVPEPLAECAVVPEDANGQQTLESVVDVRGEQGMICALDGYPARGCGEPVGDAQVATDEAPIAFTVSGSSAQADEQAGPDQAAADEAAAEEEGGVSPALIGVLVLIVALALVAVPLYRRNRTS